MKISYTIEIDITAASHFQEEFAKDSLHQLLEGWQQFMLQSHKKNRVVIFVDGHDLKKLKELP